MPDNSISEKQNSHVRPEKLLNNFQVERIQMEKDPEKRYFFEIIKFVDLDGKDIYIPRLCDLSKEDELDKMLGSYGFRKPIERTMTDEEKEKFDYAREILKLPDLLAIHATFKKDLNLKEFTVPKEGSNKTKLVSVIGDPGSGKSLLIAIWSMKERLPTFTFDRYSAIGPKEIVDFIKKAGFDENSSIEDLWGVGQKIRDFDNKPPRPVQTMPLSENLDEMLEYLKDGRRPEYILVEGVADNSYRFSVDAVFFATRDSCEARILIDPSYGVTPEFLCYPDGKRLFPPILAVNEPRTFLKSLGSADLKW